MANRFVRDSNGLRISAPGDDAFTTAEQDLLFFSDASLYQRVISGTVELDQGESIDIPYGRTLSGIPIGLVHALDVHGWFHPASSKITASAFIVIITEEFITRFTTTALHISNSSDPDLAVTYTFAYKVWDYPIG